MNDFKHFRGRGRGQYQHNNYRGGNFNNFRRGHSNNIPPLLQTPPYRDNNKNRWQRPPHQGWRGRHPPPFLRSQGGQQPYTPPNYHHHHNQPKNNYPQRPASPLPGSEEARQKAIAEASALIKQQLNLENPQKFIQNVPNFQNHEQITAPLVTSFNDDIFRNIETDFSVDSFDNNDPQLPSVSEQPKSVRKKLRKDTIYNSTSIQELRNKILNQFTTMSKGKIQSLVNNPGSSKYDSCLHHLVRDMRLHLSSELRNMYNNRENNSNMIDHFNSIVPDLGVELVNLPDTMVAELSKILQVDVQYPNETLVEGNSAANITAAVDNMLVEPEDMFKQAEKLLLNTDFLETNFEICDNDPPPTDDSFQNIGDNFEICDNDPPPTDNSFQNIGDNFSPDSTANFFQNNFPNDPFINRSPVCNEPPPVRFTPETSNLTNFSIPQESFTPTIDNFISQPNDFSNFNSQITDFSETDQFLPNFNVESSEENNFTGIDNDLNEQPSNLMPLIGQDLLETADMDIDDLLDQNAAEESLILDQNLSNLNEIPLPDPNEIPLPESDEIPLPDSNEIPLPESNEIPLPDSNEIPLPDSNEIPLPDSNEFQEVLKTPVLSRESSPFSKKLLEVNLLPDSTIVETNFDTRTSQSSPNEMDDTHKNLSTNNSPSKHENNAKIAAKFDFESVWVFKPKDPKLNVTSFLDDVISQNNCDSTNKDSSKTIKKSNPKVQNKLSIPLKPKIQLNFSNVLKPRKITIKPIKTPKTAKEKRVSLDERIKMMMTMQDKKNKDEKSIPQQEIEPKIRHIPLKNQQISLKNQQINKNVRKKERKKLKQVEKVQQEIKETKKEVKVAVNNQKEKKYLNKFQEKISKMPPNPKPADPKPADPNKNLDPNIVIKQEIIDPDETENISAKNIQNTSISSTKNHNIQIPVENIVVKVENTTTPQVLDIKRTPTKAALKDLPPLNLEKSIYIPPKKVPQKISIVKPKLDIHVKKQEYHNNPGIKIKPKEISVEKESNKHDKEENVLKKLAIKDKHHKNVVDSNVVLEKPVITETIEFQQRSTENISKIVASTSKHIELKDSQEKSIISLKENAIQHKINEKISKKFDNLFKEMLENVEKSSLSYKNSFQQQNVEESCGQQQVERSSVLPPKDFSQVQNIEEKSAHQQKVERSTVLPQKDFSQVQNIEEKSAHQQKVEQNFTLPQKNSVQLQDVETSFVLEQNVEKSSVQQQGMEQSSVLQEKSSIPLHTEKSSIQEPNVQQSSILPQKSHSQQENIDKSCVVQQNVQESFKPQQNVEESGLFQQDCLTQQENVEKCSTPPQNLETSCALQKMNSIQEQNVEKNCMQQQNIDTRSVFQKNVDTIFGYEQNMDKNSELEIKNHQIIEKNNPHNQENIAINNSEKSCQTISKISEVDTNNTEKSKTLSDKNIGNNEEICKETISKQLEKTKDDRKHKTDDKKRDRSHEKDSRRSVDRKHDEHKNDRHRHRSKEKEKSLSKEREKYSSKHRSKSKSETHKIISKSDKTKKLDEAKSEIDKNVKNAEGLLKNATEINNSTSHESDHSKIVQRLIDIDLQVQKLMSEKFSLYKQLNLINFNFNALGLKLPEKSFKDVETNTCNIEENQSKSVESNAEMERPKSVQSHVEIEEPKITENVIPNEEENMPKSTEMKRPKSATPEVNEKKKNTKRSRTRNRNLINENSDVEPKQLRKRKRASSPPKVTKSFDNNAKTELEMPVNKKRKLRKVISTPERQITVDKTANKHEKLIETPKSVNLMEIEHKTDKIANKSNRRRKRANHNCLSEELIDEPSPKFFVKIRKPEKKLPIKNLSNVIEQNLIETEKHSDEIQEKKVEESFVQLDKNKGKKSKKRPKEHLQLEREDEIEEKMEKETHEHIQTSLSVIDAEEKKIHEPLIQLDKNKGKKLKKKLKEQSEVEDKDELEDKVEKEKKGDIQTSLFVDEPLVQLDKNKGKKLKKKLMEQSEVEDKDEIEDRVEKEKKEDIQTSLSVGEPLVQLDKNKGKQLKKKLKEQSEVEDKDEIEDKVEKEKKEDIQTSPSVYEPLVQLDKNKGKKMKNKLKEQSEVEDKDEIEDKVEQEKREDIQTSLSVDEPLVQLVKNKGKKLKKKLKEQSEVEDKGEIEDKVEIEKKEDIQISLSVDEPLVQLDKNKGKRLKKKLKEQSEIKEKVEIENEMEKQRNEDIDTSLSVDKSLVQLDKNKGKELRKKQKELSQIEEKVEIEDKVESEKQDVQISLSTIDTENDKTNESLVQLEKNKCKKSNKKQKEPSQVEKEDETEHNMKKNDQEDVQTSFAVIDTEEIEIDEPMVQLDKNKSRKLSKVVDKVEKNKQEDIRTSFSAIDIKEKKILVPLVKLDKNEGKILSKILDKVEKSKQEDMHTSLTVTDIEDKKVDEPLVQLDKNKGKNLKKKLKELPQIEGKVKIEDKVVKERQEDIQISLSVTDTEENKNKKLNKKKEQLQMEKEDKIEDEVEEENQEDIQTSLANLDKNKGKKLKIKPKEQLQIEEEIVIEPKVIENEEIASKSEKTLNNMDKKTMKKSKEDNIQSEVTENEEILEKTASKSEENFHNNNEKKSDESGTACKVKPEDYESQIKLKNVNEDINTKENNEKATSSRKLRRQTHEDDQTVDENLMQSTDLNKSPSTKLKNPKRKRKIDDERSRSRSASKETEVKINKIVTNVDKENEVSMNRKRKKDVEEICSENKPVEKKIKARRRQKIENISPIEGNIENNLPNNNTPIVENSGNILKKCYVRLERLNIEFDDKSTEKYESDIEESGSISSPIVAEDPTPSENVQNEEISHEEDFRGYDPSEIRNEIIEINSEIDQINNCLMKTAAEISDKNEDTGEKQDIVSEVQEEKQDIVSEVQEEKLPDSVLEEGIYCQGHQKSILDIKIIGNEFLAASEDGTIYKFSLNSGDLQDAYTGHKRAVTCITTMSGSVLDLNAILLYSGSLDCTLKCFNVDTAEILDSVKVEQAIQCMDMAWGYIFLGTYEGLLFIYNIKKKLLHEQSLTIANATVLMIKATTEGSRQVLILASRKREIMVRDAFTGLLLRTMCQDQKPTIYSLLLDKSRVYCGTSDKGIFVLDFNNGTQLTQYNSGKGVVCVVMYKTLLFAGCYDGLIYIYNTKTNEHITTISGPGEGMLLSLAIHDGLIIAGTKKDHLLKIWRIPQVILNQII